MHHSRKPELILVLCVLAIICRSIRVYSQASDRARQNDLSYRLKVPVNEVDVTFHAANADGPINNLTPEDVTVLDDGLAPRHILHFEALQNLPLHAAILVDTSPSMDEHLLNAKAISTEYVERLFRGKTDQAFVMAFGYAAQLVEPITGDASALTAGINRIVAGRQNPLPGTAVFNAVYRTCNSELGKFDQAASTNFLLLFTDGEDNAGLTTLVDAIKACQRTNTAIYAFKAQSKFATSSSSKALTQLVTQTGGRVFFDDDSPDAILGDLRTIDSDLRSQYRVLYVPAEMKHDGSLHRIKLQIPNRGDATITVRSGYYAPER